MNYQNFYLVDETYGPINGEYYRLTGNSSIEKGLVIEYNSDLMTLEGFKGHLTFVNRVLIRGNSKLSHCHVSTICNYLMDSNNFSDIVNNDVGCDSEIEVINLCSTVGSAELWSTKLYIWPNPTNGLAKVNSLTGDIIIQNIHGQKMDIDYFTDEQGYLSFNLGEMPDGIYLVFVKMQNTIFSNRLVLLN